MLPATSDPPSSSISTSIRCPSASHVNSCSPMLTTRTDWASLIVHEKGRHATFLDRGTYASILNVNGE
eukprot:gene3968-biopygen12331